MPLFEYACKSCDHRFEWLTRGSATPSVFAARSASPSSGATQVPMGGCGTCGDPRGPGSCSLN